MADPGRFDIILELSEPAEEVNMEVNEPNSNERFVVVDQGERDRILDGLTSQNTKLATKKSAKTFRDWLCARGESADFDKLSKSELDRLLQSFWEQIVKSAKFGRTLWI